jgi:hypothetical protein
MRLGRVIIKPKPRQKLGEFLSADNLRVSSMCRKRPIGLGGGVVKKSHSAEKCSVGGLAHALQAFPHRVRWPCFCQTSARPRPESLKETLTMTAAL